MDLNLDELVKMFKSLALKSLLKSLAIKLIDLQKSIIQKKLLMKEFMMITMMMNVVPKNFPSHLSNIFSQRSPLVQDCTRVDQLKTPP